MALCERVFRRGVFAVYRDSKLLACSAKTHSAPFHASASVSQDAELETASSLGGTLTSFNSSAPFDPVANAKRRTEPLPPSRYRFRSPKYYRGPLHPHQPPRPSDISSRQFEPGPFTLPRLEQTYHDTISSDIMTLTYSHIPPGYEASPKAPRLRSWVGDSPYFKNRPLRGPRGGSSLDLIRKPINFRNVPKIEAITVHSFLKENIGDSSYLHVAGMALQAITNVRCTVHKSRTNVPSWNLRPNRPISVTARMQGENMYHFLSKTVDLVLPRIKEWKGIRGSAGDSNGNISFGVSPDDLATYPEIEVNYDMYPTRMLPGCHITIQTSATNDRDARLLLGAFGLPFYGKHVN